MQGGDPRWRRCRRGGRIDVAAQGDHGFTHSHGVKHNSTSDPLDLGVRARPLAGHRVLAGRRSDSGATPVRVGAQALPRPRPYTLRMDPARRLPLHIPEEQW